MHIKYGLIREIASKEWKLETPLPLDPKTI
jgi:hypothetical protein